ncbi:hypothetical protein R80B4_01437 [Fibrobacteres bacterium R8-0-B4]
MNKYNCELVNQYERNNHPFVHGRRISLTQMKLSDLFEGKNIYLFSINNAVGIVASIIRKLIDDYLSSKEEALFGDWLEGLAIFINEKVYGGRKSEIKGIDLEFDNQNVRNIVSITSNHNWGNSLQIGDMEKNFRTAIKTLRTNNSNLQIKCINGCCYGKDNNPDKGIYFKYCGQRFWEFIGGDENTYVDVIKPLRYIAKKRNDEYMEQYEGMINIFTREFTELFCDNEGKIEWDKLVKYNSEK